jgi:hypothetical protein
MVQGGRWTVLKEKRNLRGSLRSEERSGKFKISLGRRRRTKDDYQIG